MSQLNHLTEEKRPLNESELKTLESVKKLKELPGRCASYCTGVDLFIEMLLKNNRLEDCEIDKPANFNDANWYGFHDSFVLVSESI